MPTLSRYITGTSLGEESSVASKIRRLGAEDSAAVVCLITLGEARRAEAYTWMIRYGHANCVSCHVDPSGGGLLTAYGRDEGADVLRTRWSANQDDEAISRRGKFLWGALNTPDWLLLGGAFRPALLITQVPEVIGGTNTSSQPILMQADLRAGIRAGGWRGLRQHRRHLEQLLRLDRRSGGVTRALARVRVRRRHLYGPRRPHEPAVRAADHRTHRLGAGRDPHRHQRRAAARGGVRVQQPADPRRGHGHPGQLPDQPGRRPRARLQRVRRGDRRTRATRSG